MADPGAHDGHPMSMNLVPTDPSASLPVRADAQAFPSWGAPPPPPPPASGMAEQVARALAAFKRYKWLILAIVAVGSSAGFALTQFVDPKYDVGASIWINRARDASGMGPVAAPGLINSDVGWRELARSYAVLDKVVSDLALYVTPEREADSLLFRSLFPTDSLQPGPYELQVRGGKYSLVRLAETRGEVERVVEQGAAGDSIGRRVGFVWQPPARLLGGSRTIGFYVVTPREAAARLANAMQVVVAQNSNLMILQLSGPNPALATTTLNTVTRVFVDEAVRLKRENLTVAAETIEEQLRAAAQQLTTAQAALERFRINAITMPSEQMAISPGLSTTMNPVMTAYFTDRVTYESARRDREAIERILAEARSQGGKISLEALRSVGPVVQSNAQLQQEITNLNVARTALVNLQKTYTDEFRLVKDAKAQIEQMETQTIPALVASSLTELRNRESELKRRIDGASSELRQIPARTVEEMRLNRELGIANTIYSDLQQRAVGARLSERNALPDVSILDTAVAPRLPTSDTSVAIILIAIAASVALGLLMAILLDRVDKRFRYPEQATQELGLDIVGAIPSYRNPTSSAARLEEATQLIESFRTIALAVRSAFDGIGPVTLTVTSPGPGDGKSFTSANLASALADSGYRTLLIDGDIRRGAQHEVFTPMEQSPGLLDYLAGEASLDAVVRPTQQHVNLSLLPCGTRRRHGPELLASEQMGAMLRELRGQFDAIIVDSAPLGAGIDAFALGSATGHMVIVLRAGETDRRLAQAKLAVIDRMPIRLIGSILNDIGEMPQFKYYYYTEGYASTSAEPALLGSGDPDS